MTQRSHFVLTVFFALVFLPLSAWSWDRGPVQTFAVLPGNATNPEGITADDAGNIYVTTFVFGGAGPGQLIVFKPNGKSPRQVSVDNSSALLLGLAFHPGTHKLLICDLGNQQVLSVDPVTGNSEVFADLSSDDPGAPAAGPNALAFDSAGNVYISDSFQGIIWRTGPNGENLQKWVENELLRTAGFPPFGANGLAFNSSESFLFVANTGNDTVVQIPVSSSGDAGMPEVFVQSINGADGLIIDEEDNLWVAANQADEIVVVTPDGRVIAKLGDFDGVNRKGEPNGLLFPASLVRSGNFIYVTNLSLDLGQAVDSPWTRQVVRHTISRLPARIPPVQGFKLTGQ